MAYKVIGKDGLELGFDDQFSIPGVAIQEAQEVTPGLQTAEEVIGEDGDLHSKIFSDNRMVYNVTGIVAKVSGSPPVELPKNGDTVTLKAGSTWKYGSLEGVRISRTRTLARISATVTLWGSATS